MSKTEKHVSEAGSSETENGNETVQAQKPFTTLSALGMGYGTTNTPIAIQLILGTTIPMGGAPLLFWGFIVMAIVGLCTAVSLAELCSAMPHPGGQYIWVHYLAPPSYRRFLSFTVAMVSWVSSVAIVASGFLSIMIGIVPIITIYKPDFVYERWMGFVGFQGLNILTMLGACFEHALPKVSKLLLLLSVTSVVVLFITLFAMSDTHMSPKDFFTQIVNVSGWQDGIAFIIGLNGPNWSFSCLDVATHLAEEIPSPGTNIPRALMWTIVVSFFSGLLVVLSVLINLPAIDGATDYSGLSTFHQITGSKAAAIGLWLPVLIVCAGAMWGCQTYVSRLAWTISRESGFPLHRYFSRIAPAPFYTPVWSLVGSACFTAVFGCLYLGSDVAFYALVGTGILLQYFTYCIPAILVLSQGRSKFAHGTFWYPKLGLIANIVMLSWSAIALVFYCFPTYKHFTPVQMNYTSAILGAVGIFVTSVWFLYAKKHYQVKEILD